MTALSPRRSRPEPAPARLILTIHDKAYAVRKVACDPYVADRAFRLLKADGTLYDVTQDAHGIACDCPDFVFRRDGLDPDGCKHVRALIDCGLLEA